MNRRRSIQLALPSLAIAAVIGAGWMLCKPQTPGIAEDAERDIHPAGASPAQPAVSAARPNALPSYRILHREVGSGGGPYERVTVTVLTEGAVDRDSLAALIHYLRTQEKATSNRLVSVYVHSRPGQGWIAYGAEANLDRQFQLTIRDELLAHVNEPPVVQFGLSELERQKIWRDMVRIEDRAHEEAEMLYPYPMSKDDPNYLETAADTQLKRQEDHARANIERDLQQFAVSVNLTREQLRDISREGLNAWWAPPGDPSIRD